MTVRKEDSEIESYKENKSSLESNAEKDKSKFGKSCFQIVPVIIVGFGIIAVVIYLAIASIGNIFKPFF